MELLEAVNTCLTAIGEARVTSTDTRHPSVDLILQVLAEKQRLLLANGWWFNVSEETVYPDTLGRITYPVDALELVSLEGYDIYSKRGGYLYDNSNNTSVFTQPVQIRVTSNLDFDDLPECAANVVTYRAARAVYVGDLGNDSSVSDLRQNEVEAYLQMEKLHMRNKKFSTRRRRQWSRYNNALSG